MARLLLVGIFILSVSVWVTLTLRVCQAPSHCSAEQELEDLRAQRSAARQSLVPLAVWVLSGLALW